MDDVLKQAAARVGSVLKGKWRLDALLGCGGMAAVYRATHRNGNEVAVKMLHPHLSMNRDVRERFLREGYVANKVRHRGAVIVQDDDVSDEGAAFLVMELLDGETLEGRRVRLGGKLPPDEVLRYAELVLEVLVAAHEQGIIHRDLKPENLFLTKDGAVKVLDFGIARLRELSGASSATQTGSLLGTPAYMAPEQARGRWKDVDHATDLWAVGATMFTLLSGHAVHEAETASETLALAVTQPAPALATVAPTVDRRIGEIVDRALRYDKRDRFSTAASMLEAVRSALADVPDFSEAQTELSEQKVVPLAPLPPIPLPPPMVANAATAVPESQEPITAPVPPIVGGKTTMTPGSMELTTTAQSAPRFANIFRPGGFNPPKLAVALVAAGAFLLGLFVLIGTLVATHRADDDAPDVVVGAPATGSEVELAPLAPPPATTPEVVPSVAEPPQPAAPKPETSAAPKATGKPRSGTKPLAKPPTTTKPQPTSDPWDIRGK